MSLAACIKCYDNPCTCGHEYKGWVEEKKFGLASVILGISAEELKTALKHRKYWYEQHPNRVFESDNFVICKENDKFVCVGEMYGKFPPVDTLEEAKKKYYEYERWEAAMDAN